MRPRYPFIMALPGLIMAGLSISCSPGPDAIQGTLYIIGGGSRSPAMIQEMVDLAGGPEASILVIATASADPRDVGTYQRDQFLEYGAGQAAWVHITRENAGSDSILDTFKGVTGIFLSGGDQRRLSLEMLGTESLVRIKELYKGGALIAGTSAGAAIMSQVMLTGTELVNPDSSNPYGNLLANNIETWEGFGLIPEAIIDQHHIRRKRFNRLLAATLEHPDLIGIGIDESTALMVHGDGRCEVCGEHCVYFLDATRAKVIRKDDKQQLVGQDLRLHVLSQGDQYDLKRRRPLSP